MSWQMEWQSEQVTPDEDTLWRAMGLLRGVPPSRSMPALLERARALFLERAVPRAVVREVDMRTFAGVFAGAHNNDEQTPIADICTHAEALALYVATLGTPVVDAISELFADGEPALGYVLDTVASESSVLLSRLVSDEVGARCHRRGVTRPDSCSFSYSPGHCGWDISGQRPLFEAVRPEESIGVTLNDSFLMQPVKSVSGVVIVAPFEVHAIVCDYDCCEACVTRDCKQRLTTRRNR